MATATKRDNATNTTVNLQETRLIEVLEVVCDNVGPDWKELAKCLGLNKKEIDSIAKNMDPTVPSEQCWEALCKWRLKTSKSKIIRDLCYALLQCKQKRVADLVHKLMETPQSVDQILSPHLEREEKMLEAMYIIVDVEASHWRNISKHLGLRDLDILHIQKQFEERTREKCMHALYKWRHMVPLHEYKVANLVMALRASGLDNVAGLVKNLGVQTPKYVIRNPAADELFIYLKVNEIKVENYTPTPNSTPRGDPTPRPKNSLPKEMLGNYIINKLFFHLLDCLESQERDGAHPLVMYLHQECHGSQLSEVNRRFAYIAVKPGNKSELKNFRQIVKSGSFDDVLTQLLVTPVVRKEIGLSNATLCCITR